MGEAFYGADVFASRTANGFGADRAPDARIAPEIFEGSGDPNGIRTRVPTLKGWCPRPLDDGVGAA